MPGGDVCLGDYVETAVTYVQRLVEQAVADESIDEKDQCVSHSCKRGVTLLPIKCPVLALNNTTLRARVEFDREAVINLLGNPKERLPNLQESAIARRIMAKIIDFGMTVLSQGEKWQVVQEGFEEWGGWPQLRFQCIVEDPWGKRGGDKDIVFRDKGENFALVEMKSPELGIGPQWKAPGELLKSRDARATWFSQMCEAALAIVRGLRAKSTLQQKQKPDPKHDDPPQDGMDDTDKNEVEAFLLGRDGGGEEARSKGDSEDDEMASPGFHAALSVFPSHIFPAVAKEDGSLCVGDDLMRDLWQDKDPTNVRSLLRDKDWVRAFVNRLWGWILVTLCTRSPKVRSFWEKESPHQVDTIRLYLKNADEASIPASPWSVITGLYTWLVQGILAALSMLGLLQTVLILAHPLIEGQTQARTQRRLETYRWICMAEGYILELRNGEYASKEECWALPPAGKYFVSSTAETFIYAAPPIVVKIFSEPHSKYYAQEKKSV
ncbi:hypothetical protein FA13DRAFT_1802134 [Coprinellus micaceus]|uniref:Uncharacterized protein n=1 Tax=Coprinellus micaceus TaxID=71717 RepID=A0A4Y7SD52_COPMI|nr:hypothetical protein FA13DRAFT_1802134 [Coprinellus micaceus]